MGHSKPEAAPGGTQADLLLLVPAALTRNLHLYTCHREFAGSFPSLKMRQFLGLRNYFHVGCIYWQLNGSVAPRH